MLQTALSWIATLIILIGPIALGVVFTVFLLRNYFYVDEDVQYYLLFVFLIIVVLLVSAEALDIWNFGIFSVLAKAQQSSSRIIYNLIVEYPKVMIALGGTLWTIACVAVALFFLESVMKGSQLRMDRLFSASGLQELFMLHTGNIMSWVLGGVYVLFFAIGAPVLMYFAYQESPQEMLFSEEMEWVDQSPVYKNPNIYVSNGRTCLYQNGINQGCLQLTEDVYSLPYTQMNFDFDFSKSGRNSYVRILTGRHNAKSGWIDTRDWNAPNTAENPLTMMIVVFRAAFSFNKIWSGLLEGLIYALIALMIIFFFDGVAEDRFLFIIFFISFVSTILQQFNFEYQVASVWGFWIDFPMLISGEFVYWFLIDKFWFKYIEVEKQKSTYLTINPSLYQYYLLDQSVNLSKTTEQKTEKTIKEKIRDIWLKK